VKPILLYGCEVWGCLILMRADANWR
jgi:hypothetical protein